jgi:hypothetical protein
MAGLATGYAFQVPGGVPVPSHPFPDREADLQKLKKIRAAAWGSKEKMVLDSLTKEKVTPLKGRDLGILALQHALQVSLDPQFQNAEREKPEGKK